MQQHSILSPHLHCGAESYQIDNTTIEIISLKHIPTYQKWQFWLIGFFWVFSTSDRLGTAYPYPFPYPYQYLYHSNLEEFDIEVVEWWLLRKLQVCSCIHCPNSRNNPLCKLPNTDFPNLGEIYKMLYSISGNVRDNMCERYPTLEFYKEDLIHHLTQVG